MSEPDPQISSGIPNNYSVFEMRFFFLFQLMCALFDCLFTVAIFFLDFSLPDGFVHPTLVYFTDVVIRLMPGKMFARFLASHVLNSGADEAQLPTPICLMPAHTVASYALRAILKRIKRPGDVRELFTALCQNIETMGSSYGLGSALKTKQHALINDLAVLCGKTEFSEMQKMFLHVSPLISIFLTYCSWSP